MSLRTSPDTYAFDNDDRDAADRHRYLADILDGFTRARLASVGNLTARRCLELGAGGGSVAGWLAEQVGPAGEVVATDRNPRHLPAGAGYSVLRHDLTTDPLPAGPWQLIHARLVLVHLTNRRELLAQLAAALAPGGALVIEEWDSTFGSPVLASPDPAATALFDAYQAAVREILAAGGNDFSWASQLHPAMLAAGLVVDTALHARAWPGGSPGALLHAVNIGQLRAELLAHGFTEEQLAALRRLVGDPRLVIRGLMTWSVIGRRPGGG